MKEIDELTLSGAAGAYDVPLGRKKKKLPWIARRLQNKNTRGMVNRVVDELVNKEEVDARDK